MPKGWFMLWEFDTKAPLSEEVRRALDYYQKKYGKPPTIVEMNAEVMESNQLPDLGVRIVGYKPIMHNNLYIGEE